ncbi:MAG: DNA mismatch endonuclease Vsr [Acidobacteriaceae bacterium]|nr:DNA mismatch endonuclease Vsr [Acidobacteriaceae bacterium]MBV9307612.1 DNA mismatch endonuclease Vsr [Acidobacteriaceae bacterium]
MDIMTPSERSARMSLIRSRDTYPELIVRSLIHRMGYRYRLYSRDLPGRPDLVFRSSRKVIFVHGCFWHLHRNCPNCRPPKSKLDYWKPKLEGNARRDKLVRRQLKQLGWQYLIVWECETDNPKKLSRKVKKFLVVRHG